MKKAILILFILLFISSGSLAADTLRSLGGAYSYAVEHQRYLAGYAETTLHSIGFYTSAFHFPGEEDMGFFTHTAILVPKWGTFSDESTFFSYSTEDVTRTVHLALMFGPAIRQPFSYGTQPYFGFGGNVQALYAEDSHGSAWTLIGGVGFTMGTTQDISPYSVMDTGITVDYHMGAYTKESGNAQWSKADEYRMYSIRYYMGFGFRTFR
ncbi:MAG: hypothetical protein RBT44_10310 [Sphaerochaetaceae bacterium]|jgi:hypothetical protein|nr:hypothetical protein [Sphaerochaetaceae bacterium]